MSHHISGPRAVAEPAADITDLYAFPSPEHPGRLVLVLNTLPFALPTAAFSDGLIYRFRLRPLTANAREDVTPFTVAGEEIVIDCVFSAPVNGPGEGERRARRPGPRHPRLRRSAVGSVHHGCAGRAEDDRHGPAGIHRSGRDLPRRQERPQPGRRG